MAQFNAASERPAQPVLADLLAHYLQRQLSDQAGTSETRTGEVVPFEAVPVQPTRCCSPDTCGAVAR